MALGAYYGMHKEALDMKNPAGNFMHEFSTTKHDRYKSMSRSKRLNIARKAFYAQHRRDNMGAAK